MEIVQLELDIHILQNYEIYAPSRVLYVTHSYLNYIRIERKILHKISKIVTAKNLCKPFESSPCYQPCTANLAHRESASLPCSPAKPH